MSATAQLAPPPSHPPAASPPGLADLILLRLLPATKSVAPAAIRKDLTVFFSRSAPTPDEVAQALTGLRAEGYVTAKGQRATDAGRARALQFLGVEQLQPRAHWGTVKAKYLVPRVLGTTADALKDSKKLAALLLKRNLGLPAVTGGTLKKVFEAIACQALGFTDHTELKSLVPQLLTRKMGLSAPPDERDMPNTVPRVLLKAPVSGASGLRAVALRGWADKQPTQPRLELVEPRPEAPVSPPTPEPFDLEAFANTVKAAARHCPTGRFGGYKVFISHVWEQLRNDQPFQTLGLAGFKEKLVEANRERLLTLSRADLVQLMDPADVRASETTYLTATFHFILIEEN